jgi:hypothetical protein
LTITEGAGAADTTVGSFTIAMATNATGVRDAAGNLAFFTTTTPADGAAPAKLTMVMNDTNANGKIDQISLTFSEPLAAYTAGTTPWTLANTPSGGTLASVSVSGTTATITLTEGAAAANTAIGTFTVALVTNAAGIQDPAANLSSFAATAPTDGAKPVLLTLTMTDANTNGKIDKVTAVFSETLSAYTAGTTPWTLANIPSGGTLASVAVATTTATLTITEGAGAANTTVGSFTIAMATNATGVRDAASNLASFTTTTPADGAGPVAISVTFTGGTIVGRIEVGDTMTIVFSEPLNPATIASTTTVTEADPSGAGNDTLTITGITSGARNTGSDTYVTGDATIVDFASSTVALSVSNTTVTITVGGTCQNTGCGGIGIQLTTASLSFAPSSTITDAAGVAATGTRTDTLRIF